MIVNLDTSEYLDPEKFGQIPTLAGMLAFRGPPPWPKALEKADPGGIAAIDIAGALFTLLTHPQRRGGGDIPNTRCQSAPKFDPQSASNRDPSAAPVQACPGSEREGPARVAQCPHERRSGARGRGLFAHRGKPGWYSLSGAVFEAPGLVAGFDDVAVMGEAVQQGCGHSGIAKDARPFTEGEVSRHDHRGALVKAANQMKE